MRYCGRIGYFNTIEKEPGLFEQELTFRQYKGDILRNYKRDQMPSKVNDDITLGNSISIVADPYSRDHFFSIKCAEWQGTLWEVTSVDVQFPRLILELGGVYHENVE